MPLICKGEVMGKVYRKQTIEGVTVPAVIHNVNYFWLNMGVYEDGTISCWNKTDLSDVPYQLNRGWLTPRVPEGKGLSVYGLCWLEIIKADWKFNSDSYYKFIRETVRSLNPEMANIYKTTEREKAKWKDYHVGFTAEPTPCKIIGRYGYQLIDGDKSNILLLNDGKITLTQMNIYSDGTFSVDGLGEQFFTLEEIEKMFKEKTLQTSVKDGDTVSFGALGEAECKTISSVKPSEKLKEIREKSFRVQNKPDAHERCQRAYHAYLVEPSDINREQLRKAYEAVPEHERIYLGDMDTRNTDFERILYTDEKREV